MSELATIDNQLLLALPTGWDFTEVGLVTPDAFTDNDFRQAMHFVQRCETTASLWKGDAIRAGERVLGKEKTGEILRQLGFEQADFKKEIVMAKVPMALRDPSLSPEHYYVVERAGLDETGVFEWLGVAKINGLTAHELQESIKHNEITRISKDSGDHSGGVPTLSGLSMQWRIWSRFFGTSWKEWDVAQIDDALDKIGGIVQFAVSLQWRRRELTDKQD